jgi:putative heme-binding domain-containing protein
VNGEGIDFGPKLSEIGSKLSKEAQYLSILQPDAGISFGYEGYVLKLKDGSSITGIIASQTEDEVDVRMPGGTGNRLSRKDIVSIQKMATSLMPSGLHQTMSEKELVDLVEYLSSLKKSS